MARLGAADGRWTWVAVGLGLLAIPFVVWGSGSAAFLGAYPMFWPRRGDWFEVVGWLGLLSVYLFAIEFFFRGILPATLAPRFGKYAMYVALLPYVAMHSYWPEAVGAVPVGVLLGVLRERSGSLLPGYFLHLMVATEIELMALYQHRLL
jgi:membrane protease YdiL (CAAX protease family)